MLADKDISDFFSRLINVAHSEAPYIQSAVNLFIRKYLQYLNQLDNDVAPTSCSTLIGQLKYFQSQLALKDNTIIPEIIDDMQHQHDQQKEIIREDPFFIERLRDMTEYQVQPSIQVIPEMKTGFDSVSKQHDMTDSVTQYADFQTDQIMNQWLYAFRTGTELHLHELYPEVVKYIYARERQTIFGTDIDQQLAEFFTTIIMYCLRNNKPIPLSSSSLFRDWDNQLNRYICSNPILVNDIQTTEQLLVVYDLLSEDFPNYVTPYTIKFFNLIGQEKLQRLVSQSAQLSAIVTNCGYRALSKVKALFERLNDDVVVECVNQVNDFYSCLTDKQFTLLLNTMTYAELVDAVDQRLFLGAYEAFYRCLPIERCIALFSDETLSKLRAHDSAFDALFLNVPLKEYRPLDRAFDALEIEKLHQLLTALTDEALKTYLTPDILNKILQGDCNLMETEQNTLKILGERLKLLITSEKDILFFIDKCSGYHASDNIAVFYHILKTLGNEYVRTLITPSQLLFHLSQIKDIDNYLTILHVFDEKMLSDMFETTTDLDNYEEKVHSSEFYYVDSDIEDERELIEDPRVSLLPKHIISDKQLISIWETDDTSQSQEAIACFQNALKSSNLKERFKILTDYLNDPTHHTECFCQKLTQHFGESIVASMKRAHIPESVSQQLKSRLNQEKNSAQSPTPPKLPGLR